LGTGISVAHVYQGFRGVKKSLKYIILVGGLMATAQLVVVRFGFPHLGALFGGGAGSLAFLAFLKYKTNNPEQNKTISSEQMPVKLAFFPYFFLVASVIASQLPAVKNLLPDWTLGFSYPGFTTALGYEVAAEEAYAAIEIFSHPVTFLILSGMIGVIIYYRQGYLQFSALNSIAKDSYKQAGSSSLTVLLLMVMALVMNDSGMLYIFAEGIVKVSKSYYPLFSSSIGILGAFLTGSATSSNVLFGAVQVEIAELLNISPYLLASNQAIGGSLGSAIAPAKILVGVSTVGVFGIEGDVIKKTLGYTLINGFLIGLLTYIVIQL
jgi:lactate permease